jgi:hypothetical protein
MPPRPPHILRRREVDELLGPLSERSLDPLNRFGFGYLATGLEVARRLRRENPFSEREEEALARALGRQAKLREAAWIIEILRNAPRRVRRQTYHIHGDELENALIHAGQVAKENGNPRLSKSVAALLRSLKILHGQPGFLDAIHKSLGLAYGADRLALIRRLGEHGPAFEQGHEDAQRKLVSLLRIKRMRWPERPPRRHRPPKR